MHHESHAVTHQNRLANRKVTPFSKQSLAHAVRVLAPTLFALAISGVAHAQGTMDFSGATTLMTTFQTFAMYVCRSGQAMPESKREANGKVVRMALKPLRASA